MIEEAAASRHENAGWDDMEEFLASRQNASNSGDADKKDGRVSDVVKDIEARIRAHADFLAAKRSREAQSGQQQQQPERQTLHPGRPQPPEEVARLLEELAASATAFDAGDYWIDGAWDLEGLREDVEQLHEEQQICKESQFRIQACTTVQAESGPIEVSPQRSSSPEVDYPIFVRPQPMRLTSLDPQKSPVKRRKGFRQSFAKRRRKPVSDMILAWKLRRLLSTSDQEV
jgi:hypothetical protein